MDITITPLASSSKANCYRVGDGHTTLLLECGLPIREIRQRLGFTLSDVSACLVTHEHKDHAKAVGDLIKAGVRVVLTPGTARALKVDGCHYVTTVTPLTGYQIGSWTIMPFSTVHDAAEPVGYLLGSKYGGKVLFVTDTASIAHVRTKRVTHLLIEANYCADILNANVAQGVVPKKLRDRIVFSHLNLAEVTDYLTQMDTSKLREVHLIHLSETNSDADRFKREVASTVGVPVYVAEI